MSHRSVDMCFHLELLLGPSDVAGTERAPTVGFEVPPLPAILIAFRYDDATYATVHVSCNANMVHTLHIVITSWYET